MNWSSLIKAVARGAHGASDLDEADACALYNAMLDGEVPELELGGLLIAFRIKGESPGEVRGFYRALAGRCARLAAPEGKRVVMLPSYNGARRLPNLTPLLAFLLARCGVPVLIHGLVEDFGRVTTASILAEFAIHPCASLSAAQEELNAGRMAFLEPDSLVPGIEALLATRRRLGLRSSAHTLAKLIDPFGAHSVRIVAVTHPDYLKRMREFLLASGARALLLRGTEGEPVANPRRSPAIEYFHDGQGEVLFEQGESVAPVSLPDDIDAPATARWIRQVLSGEAPVPRPLGDELAACLLACGAASNLDVSGALAQAAAGLPAPVPA